MSTEPQPDQPSPSKSGITASAPYRALSKFLKALLGPRSGAPLMVIMWIILTWSAVPLFWTAMLGGLGGIGNYNASGSAALPLVIVLACIYELLVHPDSRKPAQAVRILGFGAIAAVAAFLAAGVVAFWLMLTIIVTRRTQLSAFWRAVLIALIGGWLLASILGGPVVAWTFNTFVPGGLPANLSVSNDQLTLGAGALALIITLGISPLAVFLGKPATTRARLFIGSTVGTLVALILFGMLIAPAVGIGSGTMLYGVALSREGFNDLQWVLKLAENVNATLLNTDIAFALTLLVGTAIGSLTAYVTPVKSVSVTTEPAESAIPLWFMTSLLTTIPLTAVTIFSSVIVTELGPALTNIFRRSGNVPGLYPEFVALLSTYVSWFVLTGLQVVNLYWLSRYQKQPRAYRRGLSIAACLSGLVALVWPLAEPRSPLSWISMVLGLETLIAGLRLFLSSRHDEPSDAGVANWISAGSRGVLIAIVFSMPLITEALSLVLIPIPILVELAKSHDPAPGLAWLQPILTPLFPLSGLMTATITLYAPLVVVVSLIGVWPLTVFALVLMLLSGQPQTRLSAWLWRRGGIAYRTVYPTAGRSQAGVVRRWGAWFVVALVVDLFIFRSPVCTVISLLLFEYSLNIKRLPISVIVIAFSVTLIGWLVLWSGVLSGIGALAVALIAIIAAMAAYRALIIYSPAKARQAVRIAALIGVVLLGILLSSAGRAPLDVRGGVSQYDGQHWTVYDGSNSELGNQIGFHLYDDGHGTTWFSGNSGRTVKYAAGKWTPYDVVPAGPLFTQLPENANWVQHQVRVIDAGAGKLWASDTEFVQYDPAYIPKADLNNPYSTPTRYLTAAEAATVPNANDALVQALLCNPSDPGNWITADTVTATFDPDMPTPMPTLPPRPSGIPSYICHLTINAPITGMAKDKNDDIWLATAGRGVVKVDSSRPTADTTWQHFSSQDGSLPSDMVTTLTIDKTGVVWVGTDHGLSRFDGKTWQNQTIAGIGATGPTAVLVDSQGILWVGSATGLQRFDGKTWRTVIKDAAITVLVEGEDGAIWAGTQNGLIHYDTRTNAQVGFDDHNSGLATNAVYDLLVDSQGNLWVSTFKANQVPQSPFPGILLSAVLGGGLFGLTYRGYRRSPDTRAQIIGQQISADPDSLYPQTYRLLASASEGQAILDRLALYLTTAGDLSGAAGVSALGALATGGDSASHLAGTVAAFKADARHEWAPVLQTLHELLAVMLAAARVSDVTGLELMVNPGQSSDRLALSARGYTLDNLPPFLPAGSAEAWYALEKVGQVLHKYQEVDNPSDQLGYLANALTSVEAAQSAAAAVGLPEGVVMVAIANQWRAIVNNEIVTISGRAELRLELRNRQARRASEVQIALRLQNTGRAAAENVVIMFVPDEGLTSIGETQIVFEHLPAGHSVPVEFKVSPAAGESARVVCRVTWRDRVGDDRQADFADSMRFYDLDQEFRRISNPYIVGHPVKGAEMFYGREDVFRFIAENLGGTVQDRTIVLHGQRRSGKTSILYQLLAGRLGKPFIPVLIDMQEFAPMTDSTADFLGEIAYRIGRAVRGIELSLDVPEIEAFAPAPIRVFNRFLDNLEDRLGEWRIVLMFDEFELIESKIADGKLEASILGYFRSLIQHREHLVFIFTGTHRLQEMSQDYWSILFNIALHRQVSYLTLVDATALIRNPVAGSLDVDDLAVEKIFNLTGGHAYYIQLLCWALINDCNSKARNYATINDVNDAVEEMLATGDSHFSYIWQSASHEERLVLAALAHSIRPGKDWARPAELVETLNASGETALDSQAVIALLDQLVAQDIVEAAREGALRYRFQIEVLRLWVATHKPLAALVARRLL